MYILDSADLIADLRELETQHGVTAKHVPLWETFYGEPGMFAALVFVLGGLAGGVLSAVGKDIWEKLKRLAKHYRADSQRQLDRWESKTHPVRAQVVLNVLIVLERESRQIVYDVGVIRTEGGMDQLDADLAGVDRAISHAIKERGYGPILIYRDDAGQLVNMPGPGSVVERARKVLPP